MVMNKALILAAAVGLTGPLAACGVQKPQTHDQFIASAVSAVSGAGIGYAVGSQMGGGTGNIIMMVFGGAVGAMGGWAYGGTLMPSDKETFRKTTQQAMQHTPNGQVVTWANPETRTAGSITPTGSFIGKGGRHCRNFDATVATQGDIGRGSGVACKGDNGEWLVYGLNDNSV
jgi:surface antigen